MEEISSQPKSKHPTRGQDDTAQPQHCQCNFSRAAFTPKPTYSCWHTPWAALISACWRQQMCVRAEGEEVWVERDVVSEDSMFIPPWGEGCHCWIPVNEVWRPIPVSQIIHSCRSDASNVDVTPPQLGWEFTRGPATQTPVEPLISAVLRGTITSACDRKVLRCLIRAETTAEKVQDELSHFSTWVDISEEKRFKIYKCMRVIMLICYNFIKNTSFSCVSWEQVSEQCVVNVLQMRLMSFQWRCDNELHPKHVFQRNTIVWYRDKYCLY